ncbi:MAG: hypothetical protein JW762_03410 [Dehalococcoidales bacterium]|nr:hypothetical protein [Dehalococcoidales bacterium]
MKKITIVIVVLTLSTLISCQCSIPIGDSGIHVEGKVYKWIDAPEDATSKIYIVSVATYNDILQELESLIENINKDMTIVPFKDVSIKIGEEKDFQYSDCKSCVIKEISDENGDFSGTGSLPAFKFKFQVKVSCPGYIEAAGEIEHGGDYFNYVIVAILVKDDK